MEVFRNTEAGNVKHWISRKTAVRAESKDRGKMLKMKQIKGVMLKLQFPVNN